MCKHVRTCMHTHYTYTIFNSKYGFNKLQLTISAYNKKTASSHILKVTKTKSTETKLLLYIYENI